MDFKTYFQFKAPNKHLPQELQQIEEVKQYMVMNGLDELALTKHLSMSNRPDGGSKQTNQLPESKEYSLVKSSGEDQIPKDALAIKTNNDLSSSTNAFVTEMATRNIKDFKTRSRTNMVPRVAKRIDGQERKFKD